MDKILDKVLDLEVEVHALTILLNRLEDRVGSLERAFDQKGLALALSFKKILEHRLAHDNYGTTWGVDQKQIFVSQTMPPDYGRY